MFRTYKESIDPLVKDMMQKLLDKEDEKNHWAGSSIRTLFSLLEQEVSEVEQALDDCDPDEVLKEIVDVANFCMMIHDILHVRRVERKEVKDAEETRKRI